jgi:hypothetical protein
VKNIRPIDLTGYLLLWRPSTNQPFFISIPDADTGGTFVAVFHNKASLDRAAALLADSDYSIKCIDDGSDFVESVRAAGVRIAADPYVLPGPRTRWTEVWL